MTPLRLEPLAAATFAPFGEVIGTADRTAWPINAGACLRFHALAHVETADAPAVISVFRSQPTPMPLTIEHMERHPFGTQTFMPLQPCAFPVVVATDPADPSSYRAFMARPGEGVSYARGVWHHPLLVLGAQADFLVVDRDQPSENLEEWHGETGWRLEPPGLA